MLPSCFLSHNARLVVAFQGSYIYIFFFLRMGAGLLQPVDATLSLVQTASASRLQARVKPKVAHARGGESADSDHELKVADSRVVWQPAPETTQLRSIFWMHIPKTGSSFTNTVFQYACRELGQPFFHGIGYLNRAHGDCGGSRSPLQSTADTRMYHMHVPWQRGPPTSQPDPRVGNVVGMFRRPAQRFLSAFHWMRTVPTCCNEDWGMGPRRGGRRTAVNRMQGADQFARTLGGMGCQTRMVLGDDCCAPVAVSPEAARRARDFVEHTMAFVGLQEEWARTVCLWHARFGGALFAGELLNTRPTNDSATSEYDEEELKGIVDEADDALYATAKARFWREVSLFNASVQQCMQATEASQVAKLHRMESAG